MLDKCFTIYGKYKEVILYLFFGGLTTVLNYAVYTVCYIFLPSSGTTIPNFIAWVLAVLFAYITNRLWVFRSEANTGAKKIRELLSFAGARVATLLLETVILFVAVDTLHWTNWIVKLVANVLVIVLNYFFSKFFVFKVKE